MKTKKKYTPEIRQQILCVENMSGETIFLVLSKNTVKTTKSSVSLYYRKVPVLQDRNTDPT